LEEDREDNDVDAKTHQLKNVLQHERRFVIPTYQRDYEWTREGQWQLLIEDITEVADQLLLTRATAEEAGQDLTEAERRVPPHFMGAIVTDQLPAPMDSVDQRAVIDGQQRLTTLQLLLRGVLDVLIEQGLAARAKQIRRLLLNPEDVADDEAGRFKLWPRRRDRTVWPLAMGDEGTEAAMNHLYLEARRFFAQAARDYAAAGEISTTRLLAFTDAITNLVKLVVIELEPNDDAQVIFEVLNGRQTPLSAADLVKNLLFMRAELASESQLDALYDRYWQGFDDPWWKQEVGTGHAARGHRDILLSAWLAGVTGREVSVNRLYGDARTYVNVSGRPTRVLLPEIHSYSEAYQRVYDRLPVNSPVRRRVYKRLDRLRMTSALPLLTWLETLPLDVLTACDHDRAIQGVESWVMRRLITSASTRGYNTAFVDLLRAGRAALTGGGNVADAILAAMRAAPNGMDMPDDMDVEQAFLTRPFYNNVTQERIRMILGALDEQLRLENPKAEPAAFDYDKLSIEHLLPRKWATHWPPPADLDGVALDHWVQRRNGALHRIGNLTLVTPSFNSSVSNLDWPVKQAELAQQSGLQLNSTLKTLAQWDESEIDARASLLAQAACRAWPAF